MLVLKAEEISRLLSVSEIVDRLERAFKETHIVPTRQIVTMPGASADSVFVSMPAFDQSGGGVIKLATIVPKNKERGMPAVQAVIVVFSDRGTPTAVMDGTVITHLRTGAASALASKYLSRSDSAHLLVIGTGALAPVMAAAHCAVRPIRRVTIWGRSQEKAALTVAKARSLVNINVQVEATNALEEAVSTADIVSCATSSTLPILFGRLLRKGTFVDLVGSFSPSNREADDEVMVRSRIFVDTYEGALAEAGDIICPMKAGLISREHICGELSDLVKGRVTGRASDDEIITFKSVGTAIEDLATAQLLVASVLSS